MLTAEINDTNSIRSNSSNNNYASKQQKTMYPKIIVTEIFNLFIETKKWLLFSFETFTLLPN